MKILYGVPGEGMGHATRSKVVIDHLLEQQHEVQVVSSGNAFRFLDKSFPGKVHEIEGFHIAYKDHAVSRFLTFTQTMQKGPESLKRNFRKYRKIHASFRPNLVISDFESFSFFFAKFHRLPIISIDNMQVIHRCRLEFDIPQSEKDNYLLAKNIIKLKVPNCNQYLVSSFFETPIRKKNTRLVPPIIREEIIGLRPTIEDHLLIYQRIVPEDALIQMLNSLPGEKFLVYGYNKEARHGNVQLKAFSETEFIRQFASAKGVMANGGFSFLSEAVYLKKAVLSVPIAGQFEQFVNAAYLEKLGYGRHFREFSAENIKVFLKDIPMFQESLESYHQDGNSQLFRTLDSLLRDL